MSAAQLGAIVDLIGEGTISGKIAKDVFEIVWQEGGDPRALVEARGMKQVTDLGAIEKVVDDIIAANPDKVAQAKAKPALIGWFVGQVMKSSGGKANPQAVNDLLKAKLVMRKIHPGDENSFACSRRKWSGVVAGHSLTLQSANEKRRRSFAPSTLSFEWIGSD